MGTLQFETNLGQQVALKCASGLLDFRKKPEFGDQISHALRAGGRIDLPVFAVDLIARKEIQAGEQFCIGKYEVKEGPKKSGRRVVERIAPEAEPGSPLAVELQRPVEIASESGPSLSSSVAARSHRQWIGRIAGHVDNVDPVSFHAGADELNIIVAKTDSWGSKSK